MNNLINLKNISSNWINDQSIPIILVDIIEGNGHYKYRKYIYTIILILSLIALDLSSFNDYRALESRPVKYRFVDFDCFYLAGQLASEGRAVVAYVFKQFSTIQYAVSGEQNFLPFTYPPPFLFLLKTMAFFKKSLAYLLISSVSLVSYLVILKRLARSNYNPVLISLFPSIIFCLRLGQTGLFFGALAGFVIHELLAQRAIAGLPLGLMAIKPHLAIAIAFQVLSDRRWKVLSYAALTILLLVIISTYSLGASIWPAFLGGVNESGGFLAKGYYPLHRMVSLYAVLRPLGFSFGTTIMLQLIEAACVLFTIYLAASKLETQTAIGIACLASPLISPYAYDYDLPIVGIGLAILMPELFFVTNNGQRFFLYASLFFAGIFGVLQQLKARVEIGDSDFRPFEYMSLSGVFLQWFFWMTSYYLFRGKNRRNNQENPVEDCREHAHRRRSVNV